MRRTLILAVTAFALSVALCAAGAAAVSRAVGSASAYLEEARAEVRRGDVDGAKAALQALNDDWQRRGRVLELVAAHDSLSDVKAAARDALLCLEYAQVDEFARACAGVEAALERMRMAEAVRVMNLF